MCECENCGYEIPEEATDPVPSVELGDDPPCLSCLILIALARKAKRDPFEETECAWCGDPIPADEPRAVLIKQSHDSAERVAAFHTEHVCYNEAKNYGWGDPRA